MALLHAAHVPEPGNLDSSSMNDQINTCLSWENLPLGPAPPTTCVPVERDGMNPSSPSSAEEMDNVSTPVIMAPVPAPAVMCKNDNLQTSSDSLRCKRRINFVRSHSYGLHQKPQTPSVIRRNERERNRVKLVNLGFATLKEHIPSGRDNRKMSKVETLKAAVEYIKYLQEALDRTNADCDVKNALTQQGIENSAPQLCNALLVSDNISVLSPSSSMNSDNVRSPSVCSSYAEECASSTASSTGRASPDQNFSSTLHFTAWVQ